MIYENLQGAIFHRLHVASGQISQCRAFVVCLKLVGGVILKRIG